MKLYLAVTTDRYELPLCVEETAVGLAERLGIEVNKVYTACVPCRADSSGKKRGYKIIRVETEETKV